MDRATEISGGIGTRMIPRLNSGCCRGRAGGRARVPYNPGRYGVDGLPLLQRYAALGLRVSRACSGVGSKGEGVMRTQRRWAGLLVGAPAPLLASKRKLQNTENRQFASCIGLRHLIGCFC